MKNYISNKLHRLFSRRFKKLSLWVCRLNLRLTMKVINCAMCLIDNLWEKVSAFINQTSHTVNFLCRCASFISHWETFILFTLVADISSITFKISYLFPEEENSTFQLSIRCNFHLVYFYYIHILVYSLVYF